MTIIDAQYSLYDLLEMSAHRSPQQTAVVEPGCKSINYADLSALSDRLRDRLWHIGVRPGDRVGFRLHKSIDSIATIFGILKVGAAYVPIDAESPHARCAFILNNCQVKCLITERGMEESIQRELQLLDFSPDVLSLDENSEAPLSDLLKSLQQSEPAKKVSSVRTAFNDIAYILYTSGSTGNPKGVVLSHGNAASFVDWCSNVFQPTPEDRFSSHAPFHFDLSILDIYVSIKHGATLVLIGEELGKNPRQLAEVISNERITIWYSTPSILSLLANFGKLSKYDYSSLRLIFFAGEVFPIPQYLNLHSFWSKPHYFNLYGPTETNVCTYYEVPTSDAAITQMRTFPIGKICPPNSAIVTDEQSRQVKTGEPGELLVTGPNVMQGYWNLPEQNSQAYYIDDEDIKWYRTGDIVIEDPANGYQYVGRRDRMIKRRGYRVELGEIEVILQEHPDIREAAVVAVPDAEYGVLVNAFIGCQPGRTLSKIDLKTYSAKNLPQYMIPDVFSLVDKLPRTSTDKVDYQTLKSL